ncbi:hypothetical protein Ddye_022584 [Dipteronia dyeriana]|uniref:Reverse transcriptase domain-containing protein n=1 Tax=Dipteronia dyeriana TaxID=168575 RepID=A0AAD9TRZ0_9ROSI|nr:hypothetical protein Ddye_022584 [Dipteronia dyeriana]
MTGIQCNRAGPNISYLFFADDSLLFSLAIEIDCKTISVVLDDYAKEFGHVINFNKSSIYVSKAIKRSEGRALADMVGIKFVECHEQYLGLPCFSGRKKKHLFVDIRDRVWNKIKGWYFKLFSASGNEDLVKAILQVIST